MTAAPNANKTVGDVMRKKLHDTMEAAVTSIGRAVLPIYRMKLNGKAEHEASCILVFRDNMHLLVTAAHVIDPNNRSNLHIPVQGRLRQLEGDVVMTTPQRGIPRPDRYDFLVLRMTPRFVAALGDVIYVTEHELCPSDTNTVGRAYMAFGYPVSKNKKIDHANREIRLTKLSYAGNVSPDAAFARKLGISGDDHLFLKYEKRSRDLGGAVVNSISPKGMSGGALFDLGTGDPLDPAWSPGPFGLAGMIIENHYPQKRMVAVKIGTVLSVLQVNQP